MITLSEISKIAGVSISTVSRVLSEDETLKVTDEIRNKIIKIADENQYKRKRKKSKNLNEYEEVMILKNYDEETEIEDAYYYYLRTKLENKLKKNNIKIVVERYSKKINLKKNNILIGSYPEKILSDLSKKRCNLILCDSYSDKENIDCVTFNFKNSVYKVLDYIINRGHSNIGFIGGKDSEEKQDFREKYFTKYMKKFNMYKKENIYIENFDFKTGYNKTKEILTLEEYPTALFVATDEIALGCYKAAKEFNKKIPEDISIIGFNNLDMSEYMIPPLTSVQVYMDNIINETINLLKERMIHNKNYTKKILLETKIIERDSVKQLLL